MRAVPPLKPIRRALLAVAALAFAGCTKPVAPQSSTLVIRAMAEPGGLDFLEDNFHDAWVARITRNTVTEGLLEIDPSNYQLKPQLAERWEESADHLVDTFHLRPARFHDGAVFTAADVVAVLDAVMDTRRHTASTRADFIDLESYRAVDEKTVELKWKQYSPFQLRAVAKLPICHCADSRHPIGTGPYAFESWAAGDRVTLKRRDDRAHVDTIVFRFVKDHTLATAAFEHGDFDLMTFIQPAVWRSFKFDGYTQLKSTDNSYSYVAWNESFAPFADPRVRRAFAHLYPADKVAQQIDLGLEVPTTCPYWLESGYCDPEVKPLAYAPDEARAMLADAGYADGFKFRLLIPATSVRLGKLAPVLQEDLAKVNVTLEIEKADSAVMSQRVTKRDFEATSRVWTELDSVQDQYGTFHTGGGSNFVGYSSPEADALMERLRTGEHVERELHRRLYDDQPYLFMTARQSLDAAKKRVHGLKPSLLWYDLRAVTVDP
jgi:ABC-type transport system substrate-binding protein